MSPQFAISPIIRKYGDNNFFFLILVLIVITLNSTELFVDVTNIELRKQYIPFYFQGFKFSGLDDVLKDAKYMGYYTDKDLSKIPHLAQFSQAQYVLAPVILDLNNTHHEFILFDCTTEQRALEKIRELGSVPIRKNKFGIILAQNPQ